MTTIGQEMTHNRFQGEASGVAKKVHRISSEFYEKKGSWKSITIHKINGVNVLAETTEDAINIYKQAMKQ